jgi:hypothetical protein
MRKYGLISGAISVVCFIAVISLYLHSRRTGSANLPAVQHELSPYNLSSADVARLKVEATGGDCRAAEILTRYYFDVALDPYSGLKWVRVAAKSCPDAEAKMELGMILVHNKSDPKTAAEVADLVVQIRKINPGRAAELQFELAR